MKKFSFITLLLVVTMLVTAILPSGSVRAEKVADRGITYFMTKPSGVILDHTPEFSWQKLPGYTNYVIKVVQYTTLVYQRTVICTDPTCYYIPTGSNTTLGYLDYTWSLRVPGEQWSTPMAFVVSSPNFNSGFNGNYAGWGRFNNVGGIWAANSNYLWTYGEPGHWSPFYRKADGGKYNDFDLSVKFLRYFGTSGGLYPANCVMARMGNYVNGQYYWYPGYRFCIATNGKYEIYFKGMSLITSLSIQPWTFSNRINAGDGAWNTLRVRAVGTDFEFYINGYLVKSFSDTHKDRGYVGVMMYRYPSTSSEFWVDWAKLSVVESTAAAGKSSFEQAVLTPISEEEVIGTK